MKKNVAVGILVSVALICLLLFYFLFGWKKAETQKQGYVIGSGTTEIASVSGAAF